jgi:DNA-binding NarL/FixJ family response regulator
MPQSPDQKPLRVLLLAPDQLTGRSYVRALEREAIAVEWARTVAELQARVHRFGVPSPALVMVLPSEAERVDPQLLAELARRLSAAGPPAQPYDASTGEPAWRMHLQEAFRAYCDQRALSPRQEYVLKLYLGGHNDKQIGELCHCSEATVYEHWRRMARKASGMNKWDVVTDFHRFLAVSGERETRLRPLDIHLRNRPE